MLGCQVAIAELSACMEGVRRRVLDSALTIGLVRGICFRDLHEAVEQTMGEHWGAFEPGDVAACSLGHELLLLAG